MRYILWHPNMYNKRKANSKERPTQKKGQLKGQLHTHTHTVYGEFYVSWITTIGTVLRCLPIVYETLSAYKFHKQSSASTRSFKQKQVQRLKRKHTGSQHKYKP